MIKILLISPWFGAWPQWINLFVASCKYNPSVDWIIPTDQDAPKNSAPNVKFIKSSFEDFKDRVSTSLGVDFTKASPYKICDLRPFYGYVFKNEISEYSHFGYCDIDIIWGDIRSIYTDLLLSRYDVISAMEDRLSGHLAVFKNTRKMRNFGTYITNWREKLCEISHLGLDENHFTHIIRPTKFLRRLIKPNSLFQERYASPLGSDFSWSDGGKSPESWMWRDGKLSNERFNSGIVYLHFMHWHSNRWRRHDDGPAPWPKLPVIVQCDWQDAEARGFTITQQGIKLVE